MTTDAHDTAVLGGGCFWCLDAVFRELAGVIGVESGYAGGSTPSPSYEAVCSGRTGHAEVVRVTFDPSQVTFADLLRVFFTIHDPTTPNRQGNDIAGAGSRLRCRGSISPSLARDLPRRGRSVCPCHSGKTAELRRRVAPGRRKEMGSMRPASRWPVARG